MSRLQQEPRLTGEPLAAAQVKADQRRRLVLLACLLAGLLALGYYLDLDERFDVQAIRSLVQAAGVWGWLLYVAAFAAGEFLHVPGLVFVAAGILVYGKVLGFAVAFVGAVLSVCFSFLVVRRIGGTPLAQVQNPWLRKTLARLEQRPIPTVAVLRLLLWMAPPLNYALALTTLRFRDYLIGSTLGLLLPVAGAAWLFDWLITLL